MKILFTKEGEATIAQIKAYWDNLNQTINSILSFQEITFTDMNAQRLYKDYVSRVKYARFSFMASIC